MRPLSSLFLSFTILLLACSSSVGAPTAGEFAPRVVVHVKPVAEGARVNCFSHGLESLDDAVTHAPAPAEGEEPIEYLVWVISTGYDPAVGLAGMQFGIAYDGEEGSGVDVSDWWSCAQLEWHQDDWPMAGTGNLITWASGSNCQTEPFTAIGFFRMTVHSSDRFTVIPRPVDGVAAIAACTSTAYPMERWDMGSIGFGDEPGFNPMDAEARAARKAEIQAREGGDKSGK